MSTQGRNIVDLCIITEYFHPTLAGAAERFRRYLPGLSQRGFRIRVFTILKPGLQNLEVVNGATIYRLAIGNKNDVPTVNLLISVINHFKTTNDWPQIVQVISHTIKGIPYLWYLRTQGVKCTNLITMMPILPSNSYFRLKRVIHESIRYSPFNLLITSSKLVSQRMNNLGIPAKKICTIPNGVDTKRFRPPNSQDEITKIRRELGIDEKEEVVLFVGFFSKRKGVDLLLREWPHICSVRKNSHIYFVGPLSSPVSKGVSDEDSFLQNMLEKIHNSPVKERIHIVGEVDNVEDYMRVADVLVLPSILEGWGNVVPEAMASKLPCVLTRYEGLPDEFGIPGEEYLLCDYSKKSISTNVINLLSDLDLRAKISENANSLVNMTLDVETTLDMFAQTYRSLLRKK